MCVSVVLVAIANARCGECGVLPAGIDNTCGQICNEPGPFIVWRSPDDGPLAASILFLRMASDRVSTMHTVDMLRDPSDHRSIVSMAEQIKAMAPRWPRNDGVPYPLVIFAHPDVVSALATYLLNARVHIVLGSSIAIPVSGPDLFTRGPLSFPKEVRAAVFRKQAADRKRRKASHRLVETARLDEELETYMSRHPGKPEEKPEEKPDEKEDKDDFMKPVWDAEV